MTAVVEQDLTGWLRACLTRQAAFPAVSGVRSVALVGSLARSEQGFTSDVDLLLDFALGVSVDLVTFKEVLAAELSCKINVLFQNGLRPYATEAVKRDALRLM